VQRIFPMPMNAATIHLAINHVPLFAAITAAGLLSVALLRRNRSLLHAGIWLTLIGGLAALVALQSGDAAEHLLEHVPGVHAAAIEAHEESARVAVLGLLVCAGIGIGILLGTRWWGTRFQWGAAIALLLAIVVSVVLTAQAAHKGGLIRHAEELENRLPPPTNQPDTE